MGFDHLWAGWRSEYVAEASSASMAAGECLFCALVTMGDHEAMILERTEETFTVMNAYPYTSGHVMVVPIRHEARLAALSDSEANEVMSATRRATVAIERAFSPDGINVGANLGRGAGAGIPGHLHVHVLPRWSGDTNFMTAIAEVRVLPEALAKSYERLTKSWPK